MLRKQLCLSVPSMPNNLVHLHSNPLVYVFKLIYSSLHALTSQLKGLFPTGGHGDKVKTDVSTCLLLPWQDHGDMYFYKSFKHTSRWHVTRVSECNSNINRWHILPIRSMHKIIILFIVIQSFKYVFQKINYWFNKKIFLQ